MTAVWLVEVIVDSWDVEDRYAVVDVCATEYLAEQSPNVREGQHFRVTKWGVRHED